MSYQRPSYAEYAWMSQRAYLHPEAAGDENAPGAKLAARGWLMYDLSADKYPSGYLGCIYIHKDRRQVVLGHAGTQPGKIKTLIADESGVVRAKPDALLVDAMLAMKTPVLESTIEALVFEQGYHLSFTGHSLGGFLASLCVYACRRGYGLKQPLVEASAVTFENPGARTVIEQWEEGYSAAERIPLDTLDHVTFFSSPNLVNTLNEQLGTLYRVFSLGSKRYSNFIEYLLASHSMDNLAATFDADTGVPKPEKYVSMSAWPRADYQQALDFVDDIENGRIADAAVTGIFALFNTAILLPIKLFKGLFTGIKATITDTPAANANLIVLCGGGSALRRLSELMTSSKGMDYHCPFDTDTAAGLTDTITTHYVVKKDALIINRALSLLHVRSSLWEFINFHATHSKDPDYTNFLQELSIDITLVPAFAIKKDSRGNIFITATDDSASIFAIRDQLEGLLFKYSHLVGISEAYRQYELELRRDLSNQVGELSEKIENQEAKLKKYREKPEENRRAIARLEETIEKDKNEFAGLDQRLKALESISVKPQIEYAIAGVGMVVATTSGATAKLTVDDIDTDAAATLQTSQIEDLKGTDAKTIIAIVGGGAATHEGASVDVKIGRIGLGQATAPAPRTASPTPLANQILATPPKPEGASSKTELKK